MKGMFSWLGEWSDAMISKYPRQDDVCLSMIGWLVGVALPPAPLPWGAVEVPRLVWPLYCLIINDQLLSGRFLKLCHCCAHSDHVWGTRLSVTWGLIFWSFHVVFMKYWPAEPPSWRHQCSAYSVWTPSDFILQVSFFPWLRKWSVSRWGSCHSSGIGMHQYTAIQTCWPSVPIKGPQAGIWGL